MVTVVWLVRLGLFVIEYFNEIVGFKVLIYGLVFVVVPVVAALIVFKVGTLLLVIRFIGGSEMRWLGLGLIL